MKVVFCGTGWLPIVDAIRSRLDHDVSVTIRARDQSVADAITDADIVLPSNARVGRTELASASNLRLIQQPAAGYDGVDLAAAAEHAVPVCNAPGANGDAVAEAALLLMLGVARRIHEARSSIDVQTLGEPVGREFAGKTLVVIGQGRSGGRLSRIAEAMGMTVRAIRSSNTRDDLLSALDGAHVVSVHCPLNAETRGLIDATAIARLETGAILVNAARGPIVVREAVEAALQSGQLGGVGLDVGWGEPWDPSDPLLTRPNVFVTPHIGGATTEAFARIADIVAENIRRLRAGEPLLHRVG